MLIELRRFSCCEDVFGLSNFSLSSVRYEQILVHLYGGFVSQDAIFGDANAVKGGSQNAHAADYNALSNAATMAADTGPATRSGPTPGTQKKAAPNSKPHNPPHNAPIFPQYFNRSPVL